MAVASDPDFEVDEMVSSAVVPVAVAAADEAFDYAALEESFCSVGEPDDESVIQQ